jgi:uncharacterized protein (DUF1778 family)
MAMGRPKKPDSERKADELRIRMTEEERLLLDDAAQNAGQETSTWARETLLKIASKISGKHKK